MDIDQRDSVDTCGKQVTEQQRLKSEIAWIVFLRHQHAFGLTEASSVTSRAGVWPDPGRSYLPTSARHGPIRPLHCAAHFGEAWLCPLACQRAAFSWRYSAAVW